MEFNVEQITRSIVQEAHPDSIILFGSRANGSSTENSDLDLALIFASRSELRPGLRAANKALWPRSYPLDLVALTTESLRKGNNVLAREISKTGHVLYEKSRQGFSLENHG
ncbi:MAG: nucleotidyltransferase domain-containing protein [Opitutales bacterium]|nr:nucleotidyltransferase domain-containing protein [Opitutales bacterium]